MRWSLRVGVVTVLVLLVVAAAATGAGSATLADHGWWWRAQTGLLMDLPPPPTVPEGGLSVARGPDGDVAWSAVRFQLNEGESDPVLVLTVANEAGGQVAAIDACLANVRWRGGAAQRWDTRPGARCEDGSVAGARAEDGATWTWDLVGLDSSAGTVDVLLVPGEDASSFQVDFEVPTDDALQTSYEPAGPEPVAPPVLPPADDDPAPSPPPPAASPAPAPAPPAPVTVAPPAAAPVPQAPEVAPPPPAGGSQDSGQPTTLADPAAVPAEDLGRPVGLFLLVAALLTALQLRTAAVPAVHGVGRFAVGAESGAEIRGLGRFARPRSGRPNPLI